LNFTRGTDIPVTDKQTDRHTTRPDYHMPSFAHVHKEALSVPEQHPVVYISLCLLYFQEGIVASKYTGYRSIHSLVPRPTRGTWAWVRG